MSSTLTRVRLKHWRWASINFTGSNVKAAGDFAVPAKTFIPDLIEWAARTSSLVDWGYLIYNKLQFYRSLLATSSQFM